MVMIKNYVNIVVSRIKMKMTPGTKKYLIGVTGFVIIVSLALMLDRCLTLSFLGVADSETGCESKPVKPIAIIRGLNLAQVGDQIHLSGADSVHPAEKDLKYSWDFGDDETAETKSVKHVYNSPDIYFPSLTVRDDDGNFDDATHTIVVQEKEIIEPIPTSANLLPVNPDIRFASPPPANLSPDDLDIRFAAPPPIPDPILKFTGTEEYTVAGKQFLLYRLSIDNWNSYFARLFEEAPNLPPCGANTNAARTWVNIYNAQTKEVIYRQSI